MKIDTGTTFDNLLIISAIFMLDVKDVQLLKYMDVHFFFLSFMKKNEESLGFGLFDKKGDLKKSQ